MLAITILKFAGKYKCTFTLSNLCCVTETSFITGQVPDVHTDIKASGTSRIIKCHNGY